MAKGRKGFFDYFKISDDEEEYDEDDDYIFDEDDDYEYEEAVRQKAAAPKKPERKPAFSAPQPKETRRPSNFSSTATATDKLVSFDNPERRPRPSRSQEVYVIKPQTFDDAQTVADFLKRGQAIVINLEGLQLEPAQRIIDFIGGACYGMEGEIKAISASIFIAVPNSIEVSGDLREEILNSTFSPFLGN